MVRVRVRGDGVVRGERGGTCESEGRWGCEGGEGVVCVRVWSEGRGLF